MKHFPSTTALATLASAKPQARAAEETGRSAGSKIQKARNRSRKGTTGRWRER